MYWVFSAVAWWRIIYLRAHVLSSCRLSHSSLIASTAWLPGCWPFLTLAKLSVLTAASQKSKLYYDRQSVGQSVLPSDTHLGPATNFSHSLFDYFLDSFGFVDLGRPLWREVGSVVFSCCWATPAQPFSALSPTGLISIVYCLSFWDSPAWGYLFPLGTR
jgi:hypothetical protein